MKKQDIINFRGNMFKKTTITLVAVLTFSAVMTGCTAQPETNITSSSTEAAAAFTLKNSSGEKTDIAGLKLQGAEASQKLADVLAYSSKVALAQGYVEKGYNDSEQITYVYEPETKRLAGYNITTGEKVVFEDNSMTTVFGLEYYLVNNPKTQITLQDGHFTLVNGSDFTATIYVADGLVVKAVQSYGTQGDWTSDIVYILNDEDKALVNEALASSNHAHDAAGNDIPAG